MGTGQKGLSFSPVHCLPAEHLQKSFNSISLVFSYGGRASEALQCVFSVCDLGQKCNHVIRIDPLQALKGLKKQYFPKHAWKQ